MNIHAPINSKTLFPSWDFIGKRLNGKNGPWIRAKHRILGLTYFYYFNKDIFCKTRESIKLIK